MSCCENTKDLGCFPFVNSTGTCNTVLFATIPGNVAYYIDDGIKEMVYVPETLPVTENVIENIAEWLQPGWTYTVRVWDNDLETFVSQTEGYQTYDCWKFTMTNTIQ